MITIHDTTDKSPVESVDDSQFRELKVKSVEMRKHSYCIYSNFHVGCALLSTKDTIYTGCNVENASYPTGICAERTALVKAISEGEKSFKMVAISTDSDNCASPCGVCRQFIREFADKELKLPIVMFNNDASKYIMLSIGELLPLSFGPSDLDK